MIHTLCSNSNVTSILYKKFIISFFDIFKFIIYTLSFSNNVFFLVILIFIVSSVSVYGATLASAKGYVYLYHLTEVAIEVEPMEPVFYEEFEETGEYTFLFGYEESYGSLAGTYARDKDAVVAALLVCEAAAFPSFFTMTPRRSPSGSVAIIKSPPVCLASSKASENGECLFPMRWRRFLKNTDIITKRL